MNKTLEKVGLMPFIWMFALLLLLEVTNHLSVQKGRSFQVSFWDVKLLTVWVKTGCSGLDLVLVLF